MTCIQHQIKALRQKMEKNAPENKEFKNLIQKKLTEERIHKRDEAEILYTLPFLKRKINVLKIRLKTNKQ